MSGKARAYLRKGWTVASPSVKIAPLDTEGRDTVVKAARAAQSVKKSNNLKAKSGTGVLSLVC